MVVESDIPPRSLPSRSIINKSGAIASLSLRGAQTASHSRGRGTAVGAGWRGVVSERIEARAGRGRHGYPSGGTGLLLTLTAFQPPPKRIRDTITRTRQLDQGGTCTSRLEGDVGRRPDGYMPDVGETRSDVYETSDDTQKNRPRLKQARTLCPCLSSVIRHGDSALGLADESRSWIGRVPPL
jgi:hypothetical protein